jgi:uncharacterized membrane protein
METKLRSLLKTISWRTVALFITAAVSYAMTGKLAAALLLGTSDTLVKLILFYLHERMWNLVPLGRQLDPTAAASHGGLPQDASARDRLPRPAVRGMP